MGELLTDLVDRLKDWGLIAKNVKVDGVKLMFWGFAVALIVLLKPTGLWPWVCKSLRLVKPPDQRGS
jgi:ABC-type branched-subunit amino acid transport system permease subunit